MNINYKGINYRIEGPKICPHCHNGIAPSERTQFIGTGPNQENLCYFIFECNYPECRSIFCAAYAILGGGASRFLGCLDGTPKDPIWPESIANLNSRFIETYIQSLKAESKGLDEISGMGYRKAIEYLVKDYVISQEPDKAETIADLALSQVISNNFNDKRESDLKDLLHRATWLGNDMTHYLRYHENFDINDLKELIKLVMDEIHSIQQKRHYIEAIQSKYKKDKSTDA